MSPRAINTIPTGTRFRHLFQLFGWLAAIALARTSFAAPQVPPPPRVALPAHTGTATAPPRAAAKALPPIAPARPGKASATAIPARAIPLRDWKKAPAVVEHVAPGEVLAVSDIHGRYAPVFQLFEQNKILRGHVDRPQEVEWIGGNATLVVVGDLINKGDNAIKVIDMLRALQRSAEKQGGKVIVTMGNHEAGFLHEPLSDHALRTGAGDGKVGFGHELRRAGIDPVVVAGGEDPEGRGKWLRDLPFAAKVGDDFFIHSGNTRGMDRETLSTSIRKAMSSGGFGHEELIGEDRDSVLAADDWQRTAADAKTNAERLGAKRMIMGHIPNALDAHGTIGRSRDGALIKLDTGLGNANGPARMLRIEPDGMIRQLDVDGEATKVRRQAKDSAKDATSRATAH